MGVVFFVVQQPPAPMKICMSQAEMMLTDGIMHPVLFMSCLPFSLSDLARVSPEVIATKVGKGDVMPLTGDQMKCIQCYLG